MIEMHGIVITADAMNAQRKIVEKIIQKQAGYVLPTKGNQKLLHAEIHDYFGHMETQLSEVLSKLNITENNAGDG